MGGGRKGVSKDWWSEGGGRRDEERMGEGERG
jgi:hypothetical protein